MEKAGFHKAPNPDEPDLFDNMMSAKDLDPATGALIGRYIAEERDSGRAFRACYAASVEKGDSPAAAAATSNGLVDQLELLSTLHLDGCLTADEFAEAKRSLIGGQASL